MSLIAKKTPGSRHVELRDFHEDLLIAFYTHDKKFETDELYHSIIERYGRDKLITFCEFVAEHGEGNWFVIGLPGGD